MITKQDSAIIIGEFRQSLIRYIESGKLSKEVGNKFYLALMEQKNLVIEIIERLNNPRHFNQFSDFDFAESEEKFADIVEDCKRDCDEVKKELHSIHDGFSIMLVDAYQNHDEESWFEEYEPAKEDTWYLTVVFKLHD